MKITDILDSSRIIPDLKGKEKGEVLEEMAAWLGARHRALDDAGLIKVLREREKISSTAIGDGVALPHGKVPGLDRICALFARSVGGVDFASLDGRPTYLFFLLVAPEDAAADHLKALARVARLLKDDSLREQLMKEESADRLYAALREADERL